MATGVDSCVWAPPVADSDIIALQEACLRLVDGGQPATLVTYNVCGENDVRIRVSDSHHWAIVELLGPYADIAPGGSWDAVLITSDSRTVWRGPARDCGDEHLLYFVQDLLRNRPEVFSDHYVRLG